MRESVYDLICAILLGVGNLCLFLAYDTNLTIVEPVLRSVHDRLPDLISAHAGFYGAGVCTVFFTIVSLISPWVLGILGSKYTLLLGSIFFTLHLGSFQYVHFLPYYITSAGIGIGYALFYSGHGGYLTEHSTRKTIERNSSLTWAIATSSMIIGGVVLALTAQKSNSEPISDLLNGTEAHNATAGHQRSFRQYSDTEITIMYGAFAAVCLVANLIFVLIPTRNVTNSIAARYGRQRVGFVQQMKKIYGTFVDVRALELTPLCGFLGLSTCFWVGAYPASLIFTKSLSSNIYLPAMYLIVFGSGEIIMGIIISVASKRIKNFAQLPSLIIGAVLFLISLLLAYLATPAAATNSPTDEATPLLEPSPIIALVIALLQGMSDNSFNTSRTVLCALVIPENVAEVYAISKFYQSFTESIVFFVAPLMSMAMHVALLSFSCIISAFFYRRVAIRNRRAEKEEDRLRPLTKY